MRRDEPNPASATEPAEGSRENVNAGEDEREHKAGVDDFKPKVDLPGKRTQARSQMCLGERFRRRIK